VRALAGGDTRGVDERIIPLAEGDVHWVFPELSDPAPVRDLLAKADARLQGLSDRLGAGESQDADGLFFPRIGGITPAGVFAVIRVEGATEFRVGAWFPRRCAWDLRWGPPWHVEASIEVTCDAGIDCGIHVIDVSEAEFGSPLDASQGLVTACDWLVDRATSHHVGFWAEGVQRCA